MKKENICKFVQEQESESLITHQFILENTPSGKEHIAQNDYMFLVAEGTGTVSVNGKTVPLEKGCLFFVFEGQPFCIVSTDNLSYQYISYSGSRVQSLYARFKISTEQFLFDGYEHLLPLWTEGLLYAGEENTDLLSESMLLYAFSKLRPGEKKAATPIQAATAYLDENFSQNDLTLQTVADALGYNQKYLSHLFTQEKHIRFSDYLHQLRMRYAVLLMSQGVTSVKNIAVLTGFKDPLYFSKSFRASFGMSPKEYIAKIEKQPE